MEKRFVMPAMLTTAGAGAAQEARTEGVKAGPRVPSATSVHTIQGTGFFRDGGPFCYQGLGFFNALYNQKFNKPPQSREKWLCTFKSYGITVLRIWGDRRVTNGWIDEGQANSLYVYPERRGMISRDDESRVLDILMPHTTRKPPDGKFREVASPEITK